MNVLSSLLNFIGNRLPLETGRLTFGSVPANSYVDVNVRYSRSYQSIPRVFLVLRSSSTAPEMGDVTISIADQTATGFTARCFNYGSVVRSPGADWLAIM